MGCHDPIDAVVYSTHGSVYSGRRRFVSSLVSILCLRSGWVPDRTAEGAPVDALLAASGTGLCRMAGRVCLAGKHLY